MSKVSTRKKPAGPDKKARKSSQNKKNEPASASIKTLEEAVNDNGLVSTSVEEYQSKALSKKEKRMLKKEMKKLAEAEVQEEVESKELEEQDEEEDDDDEEDEEEEPLHLDRLAKSDSESDDDDSEDDEDSKPEVEEEEEEEEEEREEEDVPLSDVEFDSDADVVPHHKLTINNVKAMKHALERVQIPWQKHSFQEHQSVTSHDNADEGMKDIYDDTERELAFYKQSLDAVLEARQHLARLKVPFKRPLDYFAEMVKNDEHMDKIKNKLVVEASEKKAREDARNQRQLKKFGKQVQVATLQKRQLEKRDTLEKIKSLKKKRKESEIDDSEFNVGIEEAAEDSNSNNRNKNYKRAAKDSKYGHGGMKRFKRKNDADSSANVTGFSQRKMKGKAPRPGKSRRSKRY